MKFKVSTLLFVIGLLALLSSYAAAEGRSMIGDGMHGVAIYHIDITKVKATYTTNQVGVTTTVYTVWDATGMRWKSAGYEQHSRTGEVLMDTFTLNDKIPTGLSIIGN